MHTKSATQSWITLCRSQREIAHRGISEIRVIDSARTFRGFDERLHKFQKSRLYPNKERLVMKYCNLEASYLSVAEISLGSWLTYDVGVERAPN